MRYLLFFLMVLFFLSCSDDKFSNKITAEDPVFLASLAYEIARNKGNEAELVSLFKKHGYSLLDGSEAFNKAYKEVISDDEKNRIYQQKLFEHMQSSLGLDNGSNDLEGEEQEQEQESN